MYRFNNNLFIVFFICYLISISFQSALCQNEIQDDHLKLLNLMLTYKGMEKNKNNDESLLMAQEMVTLSEKLNGSNNEVTAKCLNFFADEYAIRDRFSNAEPIYNRALKILLEQSGRNIPEVTDIYYKMGAYYYLNKQYLKAEQSYLKALSIREEFLKTKNLDDERLLIALGTLYFVQKKYDYAEQMYLETLKINKSIPGRHDRILTILITLGNIYHDQKRYRDEELILLEILEIKKTKYGMNHEDTANVLDLLARVYLRMGRYDDAVSINEQKISIRTELLGPNHLHVAESLTHLAQVKKAQGRYLEAEELLENALSIFWKDENQEDLNFVSCITQIASLYRELGQIKKARFILLKSKEILERVGEPNHEEMGFILNELGLIYSFQRQFAEAEQVYKKAIEILEDNNDFFGQQKAALLGNLASTYTNQGLHTKSEPLLRESLEILEKTLGKENIELATALNNLALNLAFQERYIEAEKSYMQALNIFEKNGNLNNYYYSNLLDNLGCFKARAEKYVEAYKLLREALVNYEKITNNIFSGISEKDKIDFNNKVGDKYETLLTLINERFQSNEKNVSESYNIILKRKGIIMETLIKERRLIASLKDPESLETYEELKNVSTKIASFSFAPPNTINIEKYNENLDKLEIYKNNIEKKLARLSKQFSQQEICEDINLELILNSIPKGSVLIDVIKYRSFNFKATIENEQWGKSFYLAYILTNKINNRLILINLGESEIIDQAIVEFRKEIIDFPNILTRFDERIAEQRLSAKSRQLYQLAFAPIEKQLGETKNLYISSDGELNLIPFGVLQHNNGQYLAEKYQFNYVSSGRDIVGFGNTGAKNQDVIIMAAPDYDFSNAVLLRQKQKPTEKVDQFALGGETNKRSTDLRDVYWNSLPNTKNEAEQIAKMFPSNNIQLYVGMKALEETFKQLNAPMILHIATHGFFLQDVDKSQLYEKQDRFRGFQLADDSPFVGPDVNIENPLLRSGLVLAGANNLGKEDLPTGMDDGILTAYEISGMNLWGTDLVVLSACETGVGETRRGEGVFGLRRAFQLAGAKTVVMSLWKVPDKETQELMVEFYKRMQAGEGKARALQNAQLEMMKTRKEKYGAAHPFYWGAFVCVGDPGNLDESIDINEKGFLNESSKNKIIHPQKKSLQQMRAEELEAFDLIEKQGNLVESTDKNESEFVGEKIENINMNTLKVSALQLRSEAKEITSQDLIAMLFRFNFFDNMRNPNGQGIKHEYEKEKLDGDEVVIDKATGLMWQKNGSSKKMDYNAAIAWITELNQKSYAGFNDWRIPTLEETMSIMEPEKMKKSLHIDPIFNNKQKIIWAIDEKSGSTDKTWFTNFETGESPYYSEIKKNFYVRAIRSLNDIQK